ncbi:hypothetical protein I4U23_001430 [Adineta vaga]|nr:hypothetical protein I4U23_001430 [Adineta vaga]
MLPTEIIYEIFTYLSAIDILNGFLNIDTYFDSIVLYYNRYHVNFQSCLRTHFDLVHSYIQPKQIVSLTLSNCDDTPDQFELFISQFNIRYFTSLRSLTLIEINDKSLSELIGSINEIADNHLTSLSIINCDITTGLQSIFQQLKRLVISNACYLTTYPEQLIHLRHLIIQECSIDDLESILHMIPILHTLEITIYRTNEFWRTLDTIPINLKRLVLNTHIEMWMDDIKELLSTMPQLRYFELRAIVSEIFNGDDWMPIVKHLIIFDFKFKIQKAIIHPIAFINTFCSVFWLKQKQWYIVYDDQRLYVYTVPRFVEKSAEYNFHSSFEPPIYTSIERDNPFFYENINDLTINQCLCRSLPFYRFTNITRLSFSGQIPLTELFSIADLSNVYYLKLSEIVFIEDLRKIFSNVLPKVYHLNFQSLPGYHWKRPVSLQQIRILDIHIIDSASRLCRQFPNLERLHVGFVKSFSRIRLIMHHLKTQLSYISLSWLNNKSQQMSFRHFYKWFKKQNQQHTYRYHLGSFSTIHLWLCHRDMNDLQVCNIENTITT